MSARIPGPGGPLTVQVSRSLAALEYELQELLAAFLLAGPLTLVATLVGGYFLARRALAPVQRMTDTARQISADRLGQRIAVDNPGDELGRLAATLNDMFDRLERSFAEMQRFTADAAHELRTPLAVIRNEAEVALRQPRSGDEYGQVLENLLEETVRLGQTADQLLFLSRQDAGLNAPVRDDVPLGGLLRDVVENMRLVAQEKGVALVLTANPVGRVRGDENQLRRVFYNLIDIRQAHQVRSGEPKAVIILSMVGKRYRLTQDMRDAAAALQLPLARTPLTLRQVYADAPGQEKVVADMGTRAKEAAAEVDALFRELFPDVPRAKRVKQK